MAAFKSKGLLLAALLLFSLLLGFVKPSGIFVCIISELIWFPSFHKQVRHKNLKHQQRPVHRQARNSSSCVSAAQTVKPYAALKASGMEGAVPCEGGACAQSPANC
ncbi:hypothetical protein EJ110_NYTH07656 [Nymphaea thermarum]|nr:hypothetical protein EJ110_NYTH07656 [Nymphaea thermarum]